MENAADALKMAAAVLIFVVALSIIINAFGEVRATADTIINYKDREFDYSYVDDTLDANGKLKTTREVGLETIVPTIYKAYKENMRIVFKDITLYKKCNVQKQSPNGEIFYEDEERNYIDLEKEVLGTDQEKEDFIKIILYGEFPNKKDDKYYKQYFKIEFNSILLRNGGLYGIIGNRKLKEELGIYYMEDQGEASSDVSNVNKNKKRIITYSNN